MFQTLRFIWSHPVSAANRPAAYARYIRWQVGTRFLNAPALMPFAGDAILVCERSMKGATGNIYSGLHEFGDMAFLLHLLRPGDVFVDVGANIGSFSVLASRVVGARSIAIEPVPSTFEKLSLNLSVNGIGSLVTPLRTAAGSRGGLVRFSTDRDTVNQVVSDDYPGKSVEVPVAPIDDLVRESAVLMKVDVEGGEEQVLLGSSRFLRQPTLLAVLLEKRSPQIAAIMEKIGFRLARYSPMTRGLRFAQQSEPRRPDDTINNLWVRDLDAVQHRCTTSKKFQVHGVSF